MDVSILSLNFWRKASSEEDDARIAFQTARAQFGSKYLTVNTFAHQDILAKMYEVQTDSSRTLEDRDAIWGDFEVYKKARENYLNSFNVESLDKAKEEVKAIDPALLEEKRYETSTSIIKRLCLDFFYGVQRFVASKKLSRYLGRIEVLKEERQQEAINQKVIAIFNRYISAENPPETVQEVDEFLTCMDYMDKNSSNDSDYQTAKANILAELKEIHSCLDLVFNRRLLGPAPTPKMYHMIDFIGRSPSISQTPSPQRREEEFFDAVDYDEEEVFFDAVDYDEEIQSRLPVESVDDNEEQLKMKAMLKVSFYSYPDILEVLQKHVFPISFVKSVDMSIEPTKSDMKVTYSSSLEGKSLERVEKDESSTPNDKRTAAILNDFASARFIVKKESTVELGTNWIRYEPTAMKMGIVCKEVIGECVESFIKKNDVSWLVASTLRALTSYKDGIQVTLNINALSIDETKKTVLLHVTPDFENKVAMDTQASELPTAVQWFFKEKLFAFPLKMDVFKAMFENLEWTPSPL